MVAKAVVAVPEDEAHIELERIPDFPAHVPKENGEDVDCSKWSTRDVARWLVGLGLGEYAHTFAVHRVTGDVLHLLSADDFRELGVELVGQRALLQREALLLLRGAASRARFRVLWEADAIEFASGPCNWCFRWITCIHCCEDVDHYKLTGSVLYVTERDLRGYRGSCCATSRDTRAIDLTAVAGVNDVHTSSLCDCGCAADTVSVQLNAELGLAAPAPLLVKKGKGHEIAVLMQHAVEEAQRMAPASQRINR